MVVVDRLGGISVDGGDRSFGVRSTKAVVLYITQGLIRELGYYGD